MTKTKFLYRFLILGLLCAGEMLLAQRHQRDIDYIRKHAVYAVEEMHLYKIPASITLAQGIHETGGGQSRLADLANNHFGIKCKNEWTGPTISHDDDAKGECFRKYASVHESYRDHSLFLAERPYYKDLFRLRLTDYKGWANGLKRAGYATNPRYPQLLISKIETYDLHQFDVIQVSEVHDKLVSLYGQVERSVTDPYYDPFSEQETQVATVPTRQQEQERQETRKMEVPKRMVNARARILRHPIGREYIEVMPGETIHQIAKLYKVDETRLMRNNDLDDPTKLRAGQYLFFAPKRNRGSMSRYTVQRGDNMYIISQKAGIKLNQLYRRNRMSVGEEPQIGEVLYLRGTKPRRR
ncbi:MAG: glucosaminidase domain-containing protein [Weeksellaceae bacterium]|nr:glucosaminidase domain-containing protein [Weeksellaceae bacterium]